MFYNQSFRRGYKLRIYWVPNNVELEGHSTVTDLAKFLGQSTLHPLYEIVGMNLMIVVDLMIILVRIIVIVIMMKIMMLMVT